MYVVAIRAANIIFTWTHRLNYARRYGFLTVIEVDKTEHFAPIVHFGALILKIAPQNHVFVNFQSFFLGNLGGSSLKNWEGSFFNHRFVVSFRQESKSISVSSIPPQREPGLFCTNIRSKATSLKRDTQQIRFYLPCPCIELSHLRLVARAKFMGKS